MHWSGESNQMSTLSDSLHLDIDSSYQNDAEAPISNPLARTSINSASSSIDQKNITKTNSYAEKRRQSRAERVSRGSITDENKKDRTSESYILSTLPEKASTSFDYVSPHFSVIIIIIDNIVTYAIYSLLFSVGIF